MWSFQKNIYRGVSKKYANYPFVSSGLRKAEIQYMEQNFINWYSSELLEKYRLRCKNQSKLGIFKDVTNNGVWALFLVITNLAMIAKNNPILMQPITSSQAKFDFNFIPDMDKDKIPELYFSMVSDVFLENQFHSIEGAMVIMSIHSFVYPMQLFQHLNYTFRAGLPYNPFPTLVLDWTEDLEIAKEFSSTNGSKGIICSIDYDKYKDLFYNEVWPMKVHYMLDSFSQTVYYDYHNYFAQYNVNMQNQKGIVLFWPWEYTISELQNNELGRKLGFSIIDC